MFCTTTNNKIKQSSKQNFHIYYVGHIYTFYTYMMWAKRFKSGLWFQISVGAENIDMSLIFFGGRNELMRICINRYFQHLMFSNQVKSATFTISFWALIFICYSIYH